MPARQATATSRRRGTGEAARRSPPGRICSCPLCQAARACRPCSGRCCGGRCCRRVASRRRASVTTGTGRGSRCSGVPAPPTAALLHSRGRFPAGGRGRAQARRPPAERPQRERRRRAGHQEDGDACLTRLPSRTRRALKRADTRAARPHGTRRTARGGQQCVRGSGVQGFARWKGSAGWKGRPTSKGERDPKD